MKNKFFYLTLITMSILMLTSCAGSRGGYGGHRKGYGCPATATIQTLPAEKSTI